MYVSTVAGAISQPVIIASNIGRIGKKTDQEIVAATQSG
jgi:hypothetical protein